MAAHHQPIPRPRGASNALSEASIHLKRGWERASTSGTLRALRHGATRLKHAMSFGPPQRRSAPKAIPIDKEECFRVTTQASKQAGATRDNAAATGTRTRGATRATREIPRQRLTASDAQKEVSGCREGRERDDFDLIEGHRQQQDSPPFRLPFFL
ncbi:hypothetical protein BO94DRAFT_372021 [Aspergillus sclerotioniger CBS 115572]|uniref:Uncharacterized protein n=1 Tax=Aspergillus sclerotioniger CBS 115572 TaxID=1450535 RepID=A0A317X403_9EURO|nr:hypothetical protein BO94DRAFT_372021 [Aspergillus sclerotioniger CBS 115572]PWY93339.1 hypothetical protein BO94DRAFT_372021 [Aspergillus sclerotioniger CBS 115572]